MISLHLMLSFSAFRTSKGTFKKTIGGLYKAGKISIDKEGITLVK